MCPRTLQLIIVGFQNLSGKDKYGSEPVMEGYVSQERIKWV